jgi:hypothetical protein
MYTSCAWFFDETSGIETVQVLQYALRAAELADANWGSDIFHKFLENLKTIPSNVPIYANGYGIYEQILKTCQVGFFKIAAQYAIASLLKDPAPSTNVYCYDVKKDDLDRVKFGSNNFVCGHAEFRSRTTYSKKHIMFAAIHLGENIISAGVSLLGNIDEYQEFKENLKQKIVEADFTSFTREFNKKFDRKIFTLKELMPEDRNYILKNILTEKMGGIDSQYQQIYDNNHLLVKFLNSLHIEIPGPLKISFGYVINERIIQIFQDKIENLDTAKLAQLTEEAEKGALDLNAENMKHFFGIRLIEFAESIKHGNYNLKILTNFLFAIRFALDLNPQISISETQILIFRWRDGLESIPKEYTKITDEIFDALRIEKLNFT